MTYTYNLFVAECLKHAEAVSVVGQLREKNAHLKNQVKYLEEGAAAAEHRVKELEEVNARLRDDLNQSRGCKVDAEISRLRKRVKELEDMSTWRWERIQELEARVDKSERRCKIENDRANLREAENYLLRQELLPKEGEYARAELEKRLKELEGVEGALGDALREKIGLRRRITKLEGRLADIRKVVD